MQLPDVASGADFEAYHRVSCSARSSVPVAAQNSVAASELIKLTTIPSRDSSFLLHGWPVRV